MPKVFSGAIKRRQSKVHAKAQRSQRRKGWSNSSGAHEHLTSLCVFAIFAPLRDPPVRNASPQSVLNEILGLRMFGANQQQAHQELALRLVFERSPDAI